MPAVVVMDSPLRMAISSGLSEMGLGVGLVSTMLDSLEGEIC